MKRRAASRRCASRRAKRAFTLLELMIVVLLVGILAVLATPMMSKARNDRIAFDYARQSSELIHNARARATGTGASSLVLFVSGGALPRGALFSFSGRDGVQLPPGLTGPAPSCKAPGQWAWATTYAPGAAADVTNRTIRDPDYVNPNSTVVGAVDIVEDIRMTGHQNVGGLLVPLPGGSLGAFVVCTTPNGSTFVGTGATAADAVTAMQTATTPFTGILELHVTRHRAGTIVGLVRKIIITGAGAPRIKSE